MLRHILQANVIVKEWNDLDTVTQIIQSGRQQNPYDHESFRPSNRRKILPLFRRSSYRRALQFSDHMLVHLTLESYVGAKADLLCTQPHFRSTPTCYVTEDSACLCRSIPCYLVICVFITLRPDDRMETDLYSLNIETIHRIGTV